jgi:hypothetical protein
MLIHNLGDERRVGPHQQRRARASRGSDQLDSRDQAAFLGPIETAAVVENLAFPAASHVARLVERNKFRRRFSKEVVQCSHVNLFPLMKSAAHDGGEISNILKKVSITTP